MKMFKLKPYCAKAIWGGDNLRKKYGKICDENIDYYLQSIPAHLDRQKVLDMVNTMMDKPYNGNYLA